MRPASCLFLLTLLGGLSFPAGAQVAKLQVTDASAAGSPIRISGTVIIAESIETSPRCAQVSAARCSFLSQQDEVSLLNTGNQPIVAFVLEMDGRTPNGNFLGGGWAQERIFGGPLFAPGESLDWPHGGNVEIRPQITEVQPATPMARIRVTFAQFADGNIFGDPKAGERLLLDRQRSLENMARLDGIYSREGQAAFLKALQQPNPGVFGVAAMEKQDGPERAIEIMRRALATAKERLAAMTAQPAR